MTTPLPQSAWALIPAFLAVADTGSLSAAARALGRSQPSLGRDMQALERLLQAQLFERHARGLNLSETGRAILPQARRMQAAMGALALAAAGRAARLEGTVRITASQFISHLVLPPLLAGIRAAEPRIELELMPSDRSENLLFGAADIAIRMYRPTQLDIVARRLCRVELGAFAARSYLDRAGRPAHAQDLRRHDLVGYDRDDTILRAMRAMGWPAERSDFALRCDDQVACWQLVRGGCGIGFGQLAAGRADPALEQVLPDLAIPPLDLWLAAPRAIRHSPRIRRVWDLLAEGLPRALSAGAAPPAPEPAPEPAPDPAAPPAPEPDIDASGRTG